MNRRFVLRYRGSGRAPSGEVARIEATLHVLDRAPRMLLVEGSGAGISRVLAGLPRWVAAEEATVPVPSTVPPVRRPA
ncbi:MAG TPA: hypothetical protein VFP08_02925 [Acidimicrobiales bacterium]|nr:hypothetical protein [Acidimicrobiales bacterium]